MTVNLPEGLVFALDVAPARVDGEIAKELALALYTRESVSLGRAAELSGLSRVAFEELLGQRGIHRPMDPAHVRADIAWALGHKRGPAEAVPQLKPVASVALPGA